MMTLLSPIIRSNFGERLTSEQARQLAFLIFCPVAWLPSELADLKWDRAKIAAEFVAVAKAGYIMDATPEMRESEYWNMTITDFLSDTDRIDRALTDRIRRQ